MYVYVCSDVQYKICCCLFVSFMDPRVEYSVFYSTVTYLFRFTLIVDRCWLTKVMVANVLAVVIAISMWCRDRRSNVMQMMMSRDPK